MITLIELESETEEGNKVRLDGTDEKDEIYIISSNSNGYNEPSIVTRLSYNQVLYLARAINIWLDTGKKE